MDGAEAEDQADPPPEACEGRESPVDGEAGMCLDPDPGDFLALEEEARWAEAGAVSDEDPFGHGMAME